MAEKDCTQILKKSFDKAKVSTAQKRFIASINVKCKMKNAVIACFCLAP